MGKKTLRDEQGKEALQYLRGKRGFTDKAIDDFNLGYVPPYVRNYDGDKHELIGRIITPIYNQYNELIAISSRNWKENASTCFWHEEFTKRFYLYGLNISKDNIIKNNKVILVEGEFDTIYLHGMGINTAVGLIGTNFHFYQLSILSRYCNKMFLVLDGDKAGKLGTDKVMEFVSSNYINDYGIKIIPVYLPEGQDPDDFIKQEGKDQFLKLLNESENKLKEKIC
jgi:DNA primase